MSKSIVRFVSTKGYMDTDEVPFFCLHGKAEVVVECEDKELLEELKNLPSDYLQPRLKDIKEYLKSRDIGYMEYFKGTTQV